MKSVFEVSCICTTRLDDMSDCKREAIDHSLGLYSSLEKAENYIKLDSTNTVIYRGDQAFHPKDDPTRLCYVITEKELDGWGRNLGERTYLRNGTFCDEHMWKLHTPYKGRPKGKIRFGCGDIVEVIDGCELWLGIVVDAPETPEQIDQIKQVIARKFGIDNQFHMPTELNRDDYKVIPVHKKLIVNILSVLGVE